MLSDAFPPPTSTKIVCQLLSASGGKMILLDLLSRDFSDWSKVFGDLLRIIEQGLDLDERCSGN